MFDVPPALPGRWAIFRCRVLMGLGSLSIAVSWIREAMHDVLFLVVPLWDSGSALGAGTWPLVAAGG